MHGHITGYASVFGVPDLARDIVQPGAFAASLARRGAGGVRMLWQHDPAEPIGLWLSMVEDRHGLRVTGRLNRDVQRAREVAALVGEGALDGLSIGFRVVEAAPGRGAVRGRRLIALDLWEISLVTFPLQPGARLQRADDERAQAASHAPSHAPSLAARLAAQAQRMRPGLPLLTATPTRMP